jgi:hypothetical protein
MGFNLAFKGLIRTLGVINSTLNKEKVQPLGQYATQIFIVEQTFKSMNPADWPRISRNVGN